jgi:hypothetical protein
MKTNKDANKDKNFPRSPEKFPKTQTMPEGWSFTDVFNPLSLSAENGNGSGNDESFNGKPQFERSPEGFPDTNIYPNGWDLTDAYRSPER